MVAQRAADVAAALYTSYSYGAAYLVLCTDGSEDLEEQEARRR